MTCWHRPGLLSPSGKTRTCRHCYVAIEECPCAPTKRCEEPCPACEGSGWVAIWRGRVEKFSAYLADRV